MDLDAPAPPSRVQDLSALLQALLLLADADLPDDRWHRYLRTLLPQCTSMLDHAGVAGRWSALTCLLETPHLALVEAMQHQLDRATTGPVAHRVAALRSTDAMLASAAGALASPTALVQAFRHVDQRTWARLRMQRWLSHTTLPVAAETSASWFLQELSRHHPAAEANQGLGISGSAASERQLLLMLAPLLRHDDRWLALPEGERALILFWLQERLEVASPLPVAAADLLPEGVPRPAASARADIRLQLMDTLADREQLALAHLFEVRKLHALANPQVALRLLPPAQTLEDEPDLAEALADVLEQQIRTALVRDPAFDPVHYLQLVLVRRPHAALASALLRLTAQRTYLNGLGEEIELQQLLRQWKQALIRPQQATAPWQALNPPAANSTGLPSALCDQLLEWLDLDARPPGEQSLAARLLQLHGELPQALGSHQPGPPVSELLHRASTDALTIRSQCERLQQLAETRHETARGLAAELQRNLTALLRDLQQWLPEADARALQASMQPLLDSLQGWQHGLELCQQWHQGRDSALTDEHFPASLLPALLQAIESAHHDNCHAALATGLQWQSQLPGHLSGAWHDSLVQRWCAAMREALDDRSLARMEALLLNSRYQPLASDRQARDVLQDARRFCFDALHLGSARQAARLAGHQGPARALGGFFLHYSAVWIGLLVGAILMLDFGDPWKAMAEEGDLIGIGLTGLLGLSGTWAYLLFSQRALQLAEVGAQPTLQWLGLLGRTFAFLMLCMVFTLLATGGLWLLLSGTDEVVHGPMAWGHIVVWTGFTLLIGTFMGLIAKAA